MTRGRERKSEGRQFPNGGTQNRESPYLSGGSASKWYHKVTCGGWVERLVTRAGKSQDKELQKSSRCISEETVSRERGDPIMDTIQIELKEWTLDEQFLCLREVWWTCVPTASSLKLLYCPYYNPEHSTWWLQGIRLGAAIKKFQTN